MPKMLYELGDREHATVLAALRLWQIPVAHDIEPAQYEALCDIAQEAGDELTNEEIDALCERLNAGEVHPVPAKPPEPKLSECCHAEIGWDAWVDSNDQLNGGPFDNNICTNCSMESPPVWDGKAPPWPRSEREGNADLPEGVDEPPDQAAPEDPEAKLLVAPDHRTLLQEALDDWPEFDNPDEPVTGSDLVEWFGQWRKRVKGALAP